MKKMDTNKCDDVNHLDSDALLPPRKRLLAGLKRQCCEADHTAPSTSHIVDLDLAVHVNSLLKARLTDPDPSDDVVEASKSAAIEAAKVAGLAKANAEIKALKAAKAMAAARSALDLVAILSENAAKREKSCRKNKLKKCVTVGEMYDKNKGHAKSGTCEELARKKIKWLKSSGSSSGKSIAQTAVPPNKGSGLSIVELSFETPVEEISMIVSGFSTDNETKPNEEKQDQPNGTDHQPKLENCEAELVSVDKFVESSETFGKKSEQMTKKKSPLSICSFSDQINIKDDPKSQATTKQSEDVNTGKEPSFTPDTLATSTSTWKCQSFKVPTFVTQNKVMQL